jgi:hypothetical protein
MRKSGSPGVDAVNSTGSKSSDVVSSDRMIAV